MYSVDKTAGEAKIFCDAASTAGGMTETQRTRICGNRQKSENQCGRFVCRRRRMCKSLRQVVTAAGDGAAAATELEKYARAMQEKQDCILL